MLLASGLQRDVYLINTSAETVDDLRIRTDTKKLECTVFLNPDGDYEGFAVCARLGREVQVLPAKQEVKEEKIFPGYILIKMELDTKTWDLVQNTEGVRGFVKTDRYPKPLAESEVQAITKFMEVEQPSFQTSFSVGEAVKISEGAFADFIGSVQEIDTTKGKIKVLISFLGREAPVELELTQVTKL